MRKLAIHVGASLFDRSPYRDAPPAAIPAAAADACKLAAMTREAGFIAVAIVGQRATRQAVIDVIADVRDNVNAGDLVVLTFSGHGAEHSDARRTSPRARPDGANNRYPRDEPGGFDQSWCLRDGVLIDDDLHDYLAEFRLGVRIHVLSDSCFSGDILRQYDLAQAMDAAAGRGADMDADVLRGGELLRGAFGPEDDDALRDGVRRDDRPDAVRNASARSKRRSYVAVVGDDDAGPGPRRPAIQASVLLSAAAPPEGVAGGTEEHGLFAQQVVEIWDGGAFPGDHHAFQAALQAALRGQRVPDLKAYGADDCAFPLMRPFGAPGPARRP